MAPTSPQITLEDLPKSSLVKMATRRLSQVQQHLSSSQNLVLTTYSPDSHVFTITINNPTRANCLSTPVLNALLDVLKSINPEIPLTAAIDTEDPIHFAERVCQSHLPSPIPKVVILKSTGQIFCSGHDLREFQTAKGDYETIHNIFKLCNTLMLSIRRLPQIVISQVFALQTGRLRQIGSRNCDCCRNSISRSSRLIRRFSFSHIRHTWSPKRWILYNSLRLYIKEYRVSQADFTNVVYRGTNLGSTCV